MNKFEQLGLSESLLKAILDLGFEIRPKYRRKRFPIIGKDTDMVALAQTGTGKTAALVFQLSKIDANNRNTQALILSPTRELCLQITNELKNYSKYEKGINVVVYGGLALQNKQETLKEEHKLL
jgi:ATP-dependent RNA helicase DeaD